MSPARKLFLNIVLCDQSGFLSISWSQNWKKNIREIWKSTKGREINIIVRADSDSVNCVIDLYNREAEIREWEPPGMK